jgi:hypothetical protein
MPTKVRSKSTIGLKIGGTRVTRKNIRKTLQKALGNPAKARKKRIDDEIKRQGG